MFVLCQGELTSSEKIHTKYYRPYLHCLTKPGYIQALGCRVNCLCYIMLIMLQIVCVAHLCDGLHVGHVIAWKKMFSFEQNMFTFVVIF